MKKSTFISQNRGVHTFLFFSFCIIIIAFFFANFTTYSNYVVYPAFLLWFPVVLKRSNILSNNEQIFVRVSFLLMMIILFYWLIRYSSMESGLVLREVNWIMAGVISVFAFKLFSGRELCNLYKVMTIVAMIVLVFLINKGRELLSIDSQDEAALVTGAWYGALYMLFTGLSLPFFLHVKSVFPRFFALIVFFLTLYLNFFVLQRGINVLFTLAEIGLILVFSLRSKGLVYLLSLIIFVFFIFIYTSGYLIIIFDKMAELIPSDRLANRFRDISLALAYEDLEASDGSLAGRNELMNNSWNTFTSSFGHLVFGAGEHSHDHSVIGHHSFFLDTLARYGVIGGTMIFVYFKKQYQIIMSGLSFHKEWTMYMQCSVLFLFYVLRNFIGVFSYALVNLIILFLFPLTFKLIQYFNNK